MQTLNLTGLNAAPFTPFKTNGSLALDTIEKMAKVLVSNGVSGAFINGSTGECASLSFEERKILMTEWGKQDVTLKKVAMLGGNSTVEMRELMQHAADSGMDGVSILSPYYFKPKDAGRLVDFCAEVASAVPTLPFYFYHIPGLSGGFLSMVDFLRKAQGKIPNLLGIKYSYSDLFDFQLCTQFDDGKYQMLWGTDEALLSGLVAGAQGAVGSTYNYASPLYVKLLDAYEQGNIPEAKALQSKAVSMVNILIKYGGGEAGKAFMKLIGVDCGPCRLPLQGVSGQDILKMENELKAIDFFSYCSKL